MDKKYYTPLSPYLTIGKSAIHGLGLYAVTKIDSKVNLGISHVNDERFEDSYIRTPLGGWVNFSENPNCEFVCDFDFIYLKTLEDIEQGVELTAKYLWYSF